MIGISVTQSAKAFRILLDCMARPGKIAKLCELKPLESLTDTSWTLINTLLDHATPFHLCQSLHTKALVEAIRFATACPLQANAETASFALTTPQHAITRLAELSLGTAEYPDRSATLIIQCESLNAQQAVTLQGPGIDGQIQFAAHGIEAAFWHALSTRNRNHYPMGTDVFFTTPGAIAAIARSTRIEVV